MSRSLLTKPEFMDFADEADALAKLEPGATGSSFQRLPARHLSAPGVGAAAESSRFHGVAQRKAGLPAGFWGPNIMLATYRVQNGRRRRNTPGVIPITRRDTGTASMMVASSATSARVTASSTRGSAAPASYAGWDGHMVLTTYGRSSGFCIDPIEKKPLNHFFPGSSVLSFGTAGCNLACKFCQNWDISKSRDMDRLMDRASPEAIAHTAQANGCRSVAFTYNDPVIFAEYAIDTALACRAAGIKTVAVTAGYIHPQARRDFYGVIDAANVDLKAYRRFLFSAHRRPPRPGARHPEIPAARNRRVVRDHDLADTRTKRLRPGARAALAAWVLRELGPGPPLHFTAFHPDYKLTDVAATPPATLTRARNIALDAGLHHVHRQCPRYRGWLHLLSGLPSCRDSSRLVRDSRLPPGCRGPLQPLRPRPGGTLLALLARPSVRGGFRCASSAHPNRPANARIASWNQAKPRPPSSFATPRSALPRKGLARRPVVARAGRLWPGRLPDSGAGRLRDPLTRLLPAVFEGARYASMSVDLLTRHEEMRDPDAHFNVPLMHHRLIAAPRVDRTPAATALASARRRRRRHGDCSRNPRCVAAPRPHPVPGLYSRAPRLAGAGPLSRIQCPTCFIVGADDPAAEHHHRPPSLFRRPERLVGCGAAQRCILPMHCANSPRRCSNGFASDYMSIPLPPADDEP